MTQRKTDEVNWVAHAIWMKVFQGDPGKWEVSQHIARVAVKAHWNWGDLPFDTPKEEVSGEDHGKQGQPA